MRHQCLGNHIEFTFQDFWFGIFVSVAGRLLATLMHVVSACYISPHAGLIYLADKVTTLMVYKATAIIDVANIGDEEVLLDSYCHG